MSLPNKILLSSSVINIEASPSSASRTLSNKDINLKDWINDQITSGLIDLGAGTPSSLTSLGTLALGNIAEGGTGQLVIKTAREVHTLILSDLSSTTTISIPSGAMVLGASFNVDTAVTTSGATNTWDADFITGSTTSLTAGIAGALNTKADKLIVPEITTDVTQIQFSTAGVETFATGVIEIVVYYIELTSLADA